MVKRNHFNLTEERKMSFNMGTLYPMYCQEVLPGDKFRVHSEMFVRCMDGLKAPIMHRVNIYTHFFYVPNRLLWDNGPNDNWKDYITGGKNGDDTSVIPQANLTSTYGAVGSLSDYMGIGSFKGTWSNNYVPVQLLPFRAYQLICNEYYRDETLQEEIPISLAGGLRTNATELSDTFSLRQRCWEKDYFTSALPFTQRGAEQGINVSSSSGWPFPSDAPTGDVVNTPNGPAIDSINGAYYPNDATAPEAGGLITVNDIRKAFQIQKWLERNARAGWRYVEQILAHFGVVSPDARLQRPEYLGGAKSPIVISEVQQTTDKAGGNLGKLAGHAVSATGGHGFKRGFTEHGWIIGIISILPRTNYSQGIPRQFLKTNKFDFAFPEFSHLGEQPVYNCELLYNPGTSGASGWNMNTFGYNPRYEEYRRSHSTLAGQVGDPNNQDLAAWHMGRIFAQGTNPALNETFVMSSPTDRCYNTTTGDHWIAQILHKVHAIRPISKSGTPGSIDHF